MTAITEPTHETITREQIFALRGDAAEAGDYAMIHICDDALDGSPSARATCADAIRDARAQEG
jgi:hypothetical protein